METVSRLDMIFFSAILSLSFVRDANCIRWLAMGGRAQLGGLNRSSDCSRGASSFLTRGQRSLCRSHVDLMPAVVHAASRAVGVCQELFADRRWNCSSLDLAPNFSPDLTEGTREQSFVYALSSAAVVHAVSRACSAGISNRCSCGRRSGGGGGGGDLVVDRRTAVAAAATDDSSGGGGGGGEFRWEGCNDNLDYGVWFSQTFTDAQTTALNSRRAKVNLHNYGAGRKVAMTSTTDTCKCHGVSGSCSLRTCWRTLTDLRVSGSTIQRLYDTAVQVDFRRSPGSKAKRLEPAVISNRIGVTGEELVFYTQSPDYCLPEEVLGSVGTKGRLCQKNASGSVGCRSMCCGRSHWTNVTQVQYRCDCKYHWCCYVRCSVCIKTVEVHRCN